MQFFAILGFLFINLVGLGVAKESPSVPSSLKHRLSKSQLLPLRNPADGIVRLTDENNQLLYDSEVRDMAIVLLLTANSPSIGCSACKDFQPIFAQTAKTFLDSFPRKIDEDGEDATSRLTNSDLIFVELDFSHNQKLFQKLNVNNVPHIWIIPNYEQNIDLLINEKGVDPLSPKLADPRSFQLATSEHYEYRITEGSGPSDFANYISAALRVQFHIAAASGGGDTVLAKLSRGEVDETMFGAFTIFLSAIIIIKKKLNDPSSTILQKFAKPRVWTGLSVLLIVLFCSGYMFTIVRGVPLLARNENGPFYFAGGAQYQIGIESFLVAGVYIFIGFWMVLLVDILPKLGKKEQQEAEKGGTRGTSEPEAETEKSEVTEISKAEAEIRAQIQAEAEKEAKSLFRLNEAQQSILVIVAVGGLYYGYSLLIDIYLKKDNGYPFALSHIL